MSRAQTRSRSRAPSRKPEAGPGAASSLQSKKMIAGLSALLGALTIALYSPVLGHSFVAFDDRDYVTENPHIRGGLAWKTIRWAFTSTDAANWHPLTWLSHALDYQMFGLNAAGHHFDSVLIHALNAVVLFLLLAWISKRLRPSLLVAALFAVHPMNVESVAWVAERKNLLSALFFFLAIAAYVRYVHKPGWRRYLLVAALFAAGLMAKPMVITLPFVLLLLDYWPLERMQIGNLDASSVPGVPFAKLLFEKVPLLVLSAASAWITVAAQRSGQAVGSLQQFPLALRSENAIVSYGLYLWRTVWPAGLAALYPHPTTALPAWQWILSTLVLIVITTIAVVFRSRRYLPVGWFWFLGTLIPVIGLVQVGFAAMADRYAYEPLIGIFVMIVWSVDDWAAAKQVRAVWLVVPSLCVLSALAVVTFRQLSYWENTYTLWTRAVAVTEGNSFAHEALATALMNPDVLTMPRNPENLDTEQKRVDEARRHFEDALKIQRREAEQNPRAYMLRVAVTLNELGILDEKHNRADEARRYYEEALQTYRELAQQDPRVYLPNVAMTFNNLANVDRLQNRPDQAHSHLESGLEVYQQMAQQNPEAYLPERASFLDKLAVLDRLQNHGDEAREHYEEALKIHRQLAERSTAYLPDLAKTLTNFALLDSIQNRPDEARAHYEEALKIQQQLTDRNLAVYLPDMAMALANLGNLDRVQHPEDARKHFEAALGVYRQLMQQNPTAYLPAMVTTLDNLGNLDLHQNRSEESRACYREELGLLRKMSQGDGRYARDVARVQTILEQIDRGLLPPGQAK